MTGNYETIVDYRTLMLLEEKEKLNEGFIRESLDHSTLLISPDIKELLGSNVIFGKVLTVALSEISSLLDKEIGKKGYIIEVSVVQDYEYPDWKDNVITIKVPIKDPGYIIQLWKIIEERVRKKIKLINADIEEIDKISYHLDTAIEILE